MNKYMGNLHQSVAFQPELYRQSLMLTLLSRLVLAILFGIVYICISL